MPSPVKTKPTAARSRTKRGRITARVPYSVQQRIEQAATWRGVSVNSFLIDAAAKEADQVLATEQIIKLSRADAELVLGLMESPPKPNRTLRKAAEASKRLIRE